MPTDGSPRCRVVLTTEAREDFRSLDGAARSVVAKGLKKLECHPEQRGAPLGSRPRIGDLTTFRKLVVGDRSYRIVYRVGPDGVVCVVWVIGPRTDDECYELAVNRLKACEDPSRARAMRAMINAAYGRW